jgi:uncharacterized protein (DUF305 family)
MNYLSKAKFLGLVVVPLRVALSVGLVASTSVLVACSTTAQNQTQVSSPTATDVGNPNHSMDHGSMNHSMGMDLGPADAEYDLRFIDAMTPHHQGALEMAQEAKQKSKRPEIQKLADEIIKAQDKEIAQMKQWRSVWYPKAGAEPVAYHAEMGHSMPMSQDQIKSMMMSMDLGAADAEFDLRFINAMIPHHEGAVTMAQDALSKSKRPEIKQLAQDIVRSQAAEIKQMQQWQQAWYGK